MPSEARPRKNLRQLFRTAIARVRSQRHETNVLTETRSSVKERALIAFHVARFANQASLLISGYDVHEGHGRGRVVSRLDLSPAQVKKAKAILSKPGSSRSLSEAGYLTGLIRILHVGVVSDLNDQELTYLSTCVEGVAVDSGQSVFEVGDSGDRFFMVVSGTLTVHIASSNNELVQVGVLSSGRGFGERSILDNEARKATVRASQPSLLMSMGSDTFNWMMKALFEKKLQTKMDFFSSLPLCRRWPNRDILRFALPFDSVDVRRGTTIAKEGELRQTLDIIVQGQFSVKRNSIQIASIGRGIVVEAYEALNGRPCSNTIECSLQRSASLYSVSCIDLMTALRSSRSTWTLLLEHAETMWNLMHSHYQSAAAGTKRRESEANQFKPALNHLKLYQTIEKHLATSTKDGSMLIRRNTTQSNASMTSTQSSLVNIKRVHRITAQDNIETKIVLPEPFNFAVSINLEEIDLPR